MLGPVVCERLEEVLADSRPQVDDTRPDRSARPLRGLRGRRPRAARARSERPGQDRRHADADVDPRVGERAHRPETARRRRGARLGRPPDPLVERRERDVHAHPHLRGGCAQHVEVSYDERTAGDDRERRPRRGELDDARAGQPEPPFGGLVRIRRGAERDLLVLPRATGQLAPQHLGDVRLDADRAPVAVVGRTVGALLEVADVTERAAVRAAHVRIERPAERHAANLCERRLARLDPVLDAHESRIEHMFVSTQG